MDIKAASKRWRDEASTGDSLAESYHGPSLLLGQHSKPIDHNAFVLQPAARSAELTEKAEWKDWEGIAGKVNERGKMIDLN